MDFRPQTPNEMVGAVQKQTAQFLLDKVKLKTIKNLVLLTGSTGLGKTTIARMIANNADNSFDDHKYHSCLELGVVGIRDVLNSLVFAPFSGNYTVHIFDEIHGLTKRQQEELLQPIENLPEHAILIFTTDQPEKLITPLMGRFKAGHWFELQPPTMNETRQFMVDYLDKYGKVIGETITKDEANKIYRVSKGDVRSLVGTIETYVETGIINGLDITEPSESLAQAILKDKPYRDVLECVDWDKDLNSQRIGLISYMLKVYENNSSEHVKQVILTLEEPLWEPVEYSFKIRLMKCLTS